MKKRVAFLLACILAFGLLTACSGDSTAGEATPGTDSHAPAPAGTEASGDEGVYTLSLHQHDPAASATGLFLEDWAAQIEEASEGRLKIEIYHGGTLGGPKDTVDLVLNGSVDIGWGVASFFPGVFPASEVIQLPMLGLNSSQQGSQVFWNLYSKYDYLKPEYENFHMLLLHTSGPYIMASSTKDNRSIDDFAGQNIRGNSGPPNDFVTNLGAAPVGVVIGELYNAVDNGTVDSIITSWDTVASFRLLELLRYYMDENIGVSSYFMIMNKEVYESLPADLQKILDDYSGEKALEICSTYWDEAEAACREEIAVDYPEAQVYKLSEEEHARLQEVADKTAAEWVEKTNALGLDGQGIYEACLKEVELSKAE